MSWGDDYDEMDTLLRKSMPMARKEQTCCEHGLPKIAVWQKYLYVAATWRSSRSGGIYFKTYKLCLGCSSDWETILDIFYENCEYDTCIIYGKLKEAIQEAFDRGYIQGDHPLIKKWYPEAYWNFLKKEGIPEEEIAWKYIKENNIRNGLQPLLPALS